MSADTTEQYTANGDDDLRARYLPVSRKELRRRREADRVAQEETADQPETAEKPALQPEPDEELTRMVEDTSASEGDDLSDTPSEPPAEPEAEVTPEESLESQVESDEASSEHAETKVALPTPPEPADEPARPEEEIADAEESTQVEEQDMGAEPIDSEEASGPAGHTRRARRLLRETESIPRLSPQLLAELDATNAEIAVIEDPNRVDPELLKKQQALAAKAMQANQERMRKEHAAAEKERRRRSRERPESQVLTEKMLRDSLQEDPEEMQYFTGQIEPVHAQGAHGLDLNKMIDVTSRQANRRNYLLWAAIILAVLLLAAVVAGIYVFFFL